MAAAAVEIVTKMPFAPEPFPDLVIYAMEDGLLLKETENPDDWNSLVWI